MAAAVGVVWVAAVGIQVALAAADAHAGRAAINAAQRSVGADSLVGGEAQAVLQRAHVAFSRAHARLTSPLVQPARVLPVVGRQLRSFAALAGASGQAAEIGATAVTSARQALKRATAGGPERVTALRQVDEITDTAQEGLAGIDLGPDAHLLSSLAQAREELAQRLAEGGDGLERTGLVTAAVADMLQGPSRYLLLASNNAEMRAGSGMFLSAGILEARDGALTLGPLLPTGDLTLPGAGLEGDGDLQARWGWLHPGREWRNLGLSPRFDATAELAARMWQAVDGTPVEGVLSIDVATLRALLSATGPVPVGEGVVGPDEVVDLLMHEQYLDLPEVGAPDEVDQVARRDRLGELAGSVLGELDSGSYDFGVLTSELVTAARGRHLLAWSADGDQQKAWEAAGISGSLGPDSLLVSVINRGGNKLDRFLEVSTSLTLEPVAGGVDVTVEVRVANRTPDGEPWYVAGPAPGTGLEPGDYLGMVSANVPAVATDVRIDGDPVLVAAGWDGPTQVIAAPIMVPAGSGHTVVVRFRLPGSGTLRVEPSARLPATQWDMGDTNWTGDVPRTIPW